MICVCTNYIDNVDIIGNIIDFSGTLNSGGCFNVDGSGFVNNFIIAKNKAANMPCTFANCKKVLHYMNQFSTLDVANATDVMDLELLFV